MKKILKIRILCNDVVHNLYMLLNAISTVESRRLQRAGRLTSIQQVRDTEHWCGIFLGKRLLERSRMGWENNIKTGLQEIDWYVGEGDEQDQNTIQLVL
jgi:hypothetical protein